MPFTYTGRNVKPGSTTYPSLVDIAVGMSRQPRFSGQGHRWFSVLDHSLFMDEMVKATPDAFVWALSGTSGGSGHDEDRRLSRLAVLLHDAHEALTADVPSPFKSPAFSMIQDDLDRLIGGAFYPLRNLHEEMTRAAVKHYDKRALMAEARVIGPSVDADRILTAFGVSDDTHEDMQLLERLLKMEEVGVPPRAWNQGGHPTVLEYLHRMMDLL